MVNVNIEKSGHKHLEGGFLGTPQGDREMRSAEVFWIAFDRALHRVRYAWTLETRCLFLLHRELANHLPRRDILLFLDRRIQHLRDLRRDEEINMANLEESARGAEIMARIYYEENHL